MPLAEVPAVSLAGWRFGTQRPRFFSVDYRPTEAHSRDLRTGHLRFLSGDHSTPSRFVVIFTQNNPDIRLSVFSHFDYGPLLAYTT